MSTIQKSLFWRDLRPVAYLACLLVLALFTQLVPGNATNALAYTILSPNQVKTMVENGTAGTIIDVREYNEYCTVNGGHIPCALNYPWNTGYLQSHYTELDPNATYIIVCGSGSRSASASFFLESQGFTKIYNMSGGMSSWQGETQTCDSVCPALYFPHIATSSPWQTEIAIINTSTNQTVTGTLRGLSDEGQLIETKDVTLSARGRRQITIADEFTNHTNIGYIIFDTNSNAVQGYTKFYIAGYYRAAIPAVKEVNNNDIYIPHIASNADWWTGVSLVNTTSASKVLTITFNNGQSWQIPLAANQHRAFDIAQEFFNNQPQPDIKSAVITHASGVIGLELSGSLGWGTQLEGVLLTDKTTSTIYYPHVASDAYWWTGIVAYNPSASSCTITITPYSAQGTPLTPSTLSIPGKGKYIGPVSQLGLPAQTAWFKIDSTTPITGFELFGATDGSQLAAYAGGGGTGAKSGVFAKIEKNGWTGIAFVNTEATAAYVTLTAHTDNGTAVATRVLPVPSHAKIVNNPEAIFSQDIGTATYIAYSSDRNVVGFQLNGSSDGTMLDGLPVFVGGSISQSYRYVGALVPGWHWGYGQGFWSKAIDDDLIQSAKDNGITVFHLMLPLFEKQLGIYNEEELAKLDHFLDSASRIGIYVMISFINIFGNLAMQTNDPYYNPTGIEGLMYDEELKSAFKNRINFLINRQNTINGRIYKEDPTISAWIIGDEPISAPFNYPVRPPDLTVLQFSTWLEEMAFYIKSLDQNHFVTINITPAQSSLKGGDWMQSVNVPSLDFIYAEDADMRILNYFWANAAKEYSLRLFTLNKPVVFSLSFTSGEWNQSIICKDYSFQAQLLGNAINRYFEVRATGVLVQTWGSDLYPFVPSFDQCFNYTDSNVLISGVLKGAASNLNQ